MKPNYIGRRRALQGIGGGAAFVGAAAFLGGCGDNDDDGGDSSNGPAPTVDTRPTPAPSVVAKKGGTLKVALSGDPTGLDPSTSRGGNDHHWLYSIFDNLVNNDPKFQVNAAAAGAILLGMTLLMNGIAIWLRYRFRKRINW